MPDSSQPVDRATDRLEVLSVGGALEQGADRALTGESVDIGKQIAAVPHRDHDVGFDRDLHLLQRQSGEQSAIDDAAGASDGACVGARQECDHGCDFCWLAKSADGMPLGPILERCRGVSW